ncbi:hypothetical protein HPP92_007327 [Vanilla planifolia]|uniref:Uncharacterized protein n=1 Tax=Vanilla planifolia TaxID=51239 RepID=A0A835RAN0_VANPL|nr:hypothetical protein HPP92_007531 [Vanilla planifolia]KAG0490464.1 hypothetical protein HPP92_007327 [Vanilla planifolia]
MAQSPFHYGTANVCKSEKYYALSVESGSEGGLAFPEMLGLSMADDSSPESGCVGVLIARRRELEQ